MGHPIKFRKLSVEAGIAQLDNGIAATTAALGDTAQLRRSSASWASLDRAGPGLCGHAGPDDLGRRHAGRRLAQDQRQGGRQAAISRIEAKGKAFCCCTTSTSGPSRRCRSS